MVKLGIIGCGRQASRLMFAFNELKVFKITALCDLDSSNFKIFLDTIEDKDNVFLTNSYTELIDKADVEAVIIATPTCEHLDPATYALKKKKNVFIEKPIGLDINEIDKFIKLALHSNNIVQVGFPYHYAHYFSLIQALLRNEKYRGCKYITVSEHRNPFLGSWFFDKDKSGGAINDKLIHYFDVSNVTFYPSKPIKVYATGSQHFYHKNMRLEPVSGFHFNVDNPTIIDNGSVIVEYDNNAILTITLNMYQKMPIEGTEMKFTSLSGEHINLKLDGNDVLIKMTDEAKQIQDYTIENRDNDAISFNHPGAKDEFREFYQSIKDKTQPQSNLWHARNAQVIALAAEESVVTGLPVDLKKFESPEIDRLSMEKGWVTDYHAIKYRKEKIEDLKNITAVSKGDSIDKLYKALRKLFPKHEKPKYLVLNNELLSSAIVNVSKNLEFQKSIKGVSITIIVSTLLKDFILKIKENKIDIINEKDIDQSDTRLTIKLTDIGYESVILNKSIVKNYINGNIQLIGDIKVFQNLRDPIFKIMNEIQKLAQNDQTGSGV